MQKQLSFFSLWSFIVGFIFLGILPDVAAWLSTPEDLVFRGAYVNVDDLSVYLSAIRQGQEGQWLFRPSFSPEPFPSYIAFIPYFLVGKLSAFLGGGSLLWFNVLRIASGVFAMYALFYWLKIIFPDSPKLQKTGWLLATFGSGFAWILIVIFPPPSPFLTDLSTPEWNPLLNFLASPHFILGAGLLALYFAQLQQAFNNSSSIRLTIATFLTVLALSLSYPYAIPIIGLTSGLQIVLFAIQERKMPWKQAGHTVFGLIPGIGSLYYYGLYLQIDPIWKISLTQNNSIPSPHPLGLVLGFGLLGLFAIFGIRLWYQNKLSSLPLIWLMVHLIVIYLPIAYSGRFTVGLFIPVCTLAAYGLETHILPRLESTRFYKGFSKYTPTPYASLRRVLIILTIPTTLLISVWSLRSTFAEASYPYYYPKAEVEAAQWLGEHTTENDLILVHYPIGNHLPRYTNARVFIGHFDLTIDLDRKFELSQQFWNPATSDEWRQEFLEDWGINYIYQGEFENSLYGTSITPPGTIIFQNQTIDIYMLDGE